jgi:hypothetical protein
MLPSREMKNAYQLLLLVNYSDIIVTFGFILLDLFRQRIIVFFSQFEPRA